MSWYNQVQRHSLAARGISTNPTIRTSSTSLSAKRFVESSTNLGSIYAYLEREDNKHLPESELKEKLIEKYPDLTNGRAEVLVERYRHSNLGKKSQLIDAKHHSTLKQVGVPTSEQVNVAYNRLQGKGDVILEEDPLSELSEAELKARLKRDFSDFVERAEEVESIQKMADERKKAKARIEEDLLADEYFSPKINDDRKSMAYKFIGGKNEDPGEFVKDNLKSTEDHSIEKFWSGVKYTLDHPFEDADGEWVEYNLIAGNKNVLLSKDKAERAEQRGAAIFARVASQANMEPLIEKGKNRSFRQIITELEFGRRDGDEQDDKKLIDNHLEK